MGAMASTVIAAPQHQLGEVAGRNVEVAAATAWKKSTMRPTSSPEALLR
jgi:hypothetical protein